MTQKHDYSAKQVPFMSNKANLGYREASTKRESRVRLVLRAPLSRVSGSAPLKYNTYSASFCILFFPFDTKDTM